MEEYKMDDKKVKKPIFSEDDWMKRFDNHEVAIITMQKHLASQADYVFKLENKVKQQEKMIDRLLSLIEQQHQAVLTLRDCIDYMSKHVVIKNDSTTEISKLTN